MIRVERKRTKGFKTPPNTRYVGRGTKFGNPFRLTPDGFIMCYSINRNILDPWIMWSASAGFTIQDILELYEMWLNEELKDRKYLPTPPTREELDSLKGKNLSCFCSLDQPCHADVLFKFLKTR